jgi:fatty acid desaturase
MTYGPSHFETLVIDRKEWRTVLLGLTIYSLWFALTWFHSYIPGPLLFILGGLTLTWFTSFQHECVHGHPTKLPWLNDLLAFPPLTLYLPFVIYRDTHTTHHNEEILAIPGVDPESFYVAKENWNNLSGISKLYLASRNSLAGRMILGPIEAVVRSAIDLINAFRTRNVRMIMAWFWYGLGVVAVYYWVSIICDLPFWIYALCFAYPSISFTLFRSYCEHKDSPDPRHRTAIIRTNKFLNLLYLYNSLHMVHHMNPGAPWYELQDAYDQNRDFYDERTGGFVFSGYMKIIKQYLFRPLDHSVFIGNG